MATQSPIFKLKCSLIAAAVVFLFSATVLSQESFLFDISKLKVDAGSVQELKGVTKIFFFSKLNKGPAGEVLSLLKRSGFPFQVVESVDDAEIILSFSIVATLSLSKLPDLAEPRTSGYNFARYRGRGIVFKRISSTNIRMLIDFDQRTQNKYYSAPWKMFIKDFIAKYKTANSQSNLEKAKNDRDPTLVT